MNMQWNIETFISVSAIIACLIGSYSIIKIDWKKYGLLFIVSAIMGGIICYVFITIGFYSYPFRNFPTISRMPFDTILTSFPFLVLFSIRFSPKSWAYKIPFYMGIVHIGMLGETLCLLNTELIQYNFKWDFWDSYTWWWIYLLLFEQIGRLIIPDHLREPIDSEAFNYGKWLFYILHFIFILTIFLGGYYLGLVKGKSL
ncbi:CBO0543 family protein [Brassicibacter mesophilus]|uniref:CBO0543 family protein n=1 Tax=Brassicibacter mesophilus TaxID=745119 RepID=UPI003D1AE5A9